MSVYYDGQHSVTFGLKKTGETLKSWDDLHLIPTSPPYVALPTATTNFVEIPGRNGSFDLSEVLTDGPTFGDRKGSLSFAFDIQKIVNSKKLTYRNGRELLVGSGIEKLHNAQGWMRIDDEEDIYYAGRFTVEAYNRSKTYPEVKITYQLLPETFVSASAALNALG